MAIVQLVINGHSYPIACDEGEEPRVRELGEYIGRRVSELSKQIGATGETRLMLMAALLVADELSEALGKIEDQEKELASLREAHSSAEGTLKDTEDALAEALESAAAQIEGITSRIGNAA